MTVQRLITMKHHVAVCLHLMQGRWQVAWICGLRPLQRECDVTVVYRKKIISRTPTGVAGDVCYRGKVTSWERISADVAGVSLETSAKWRHPREFNCWRNALFANWCGNCFVKNLFHKDLVTRHLFLQKTIRGDLLLVCHLFSRKIYSAELTCSHCICFRKKKKYLMTSPSWIPGIDVTFTESLVALVFFVARGRVSRRARFSRNCHFLTIFFI